MDEEKKGKRPAHEVVLGMLEKLADIAVLSEHGNMMQVSVLCQVLREMVIPEKHRGAIVTRLRGLEEATFDQEVVHNMLHETADQLEGALSQEDQDALKALEDRRISNEGIKRKEPSDSLMYFYCKSCCAEMLIPIISTASVSRTIAALEHCKDCKDLKDRGLLE